MLDQIKPLVETGFAVHPLGPRSKIPIGRWTTAPVHTFDSLRKVYRRGMNLGVRLGEPSRVDGRYLHVIDMDIRVKGEADAAWSALKKTLPGVRLNRLPKVKSGSGGESCHLYFLCDDPFPGHKIATSGKYFKDASGKKRLTWEIELFGTGKQVVLPPSIHPDTGKAYRWEIRPEPIIPIIDASLIGDMVYAGDSGDIDPADTEILDLSPAQAESFLDDLELDIWCEDYEGWRNVGMALHHEFEGSKEGFRLWVRFSKQSRKFDLAVCQKRWESFGRYRGRPITMRSIMSAASKSSMDRDFDELDARDDGEDDTPERPKKSKGDPDLIILKQSPEVAPPFPTKLLGKFWAKQIKLMAGNASAPEDFVVAGLLSVAASLIGNAVEIIEAFGGRPYVIDRVKDNGVSIPIPRMTVSMVGGMQPDRLMEMVLAKDDGLETRFLPFWPEVTSRPLTDGVRLGDEVFEALQRLTELPMLEGRYGGLEPDVIPFTAEAFKHFQKWVDRHQGSSEERYAHPKLQMMFGKANGHVARLALVIEFLWWCAATDDYDEIPAPKHIGIDAVRAAIQIRETYIVPMQRRVIGHGLRSPAPIKARAIATWIMEKRPSNAFTASQLRREAGIEGISGRTDPAELDDAIAYLAELNWLSKETVKTKGRPLHRFVANPRLYDLLDRQHDDLV